MVTQLNIVMNIIWAIKYIVLKSKIQNRNFFQKI